MTRGGLACALVLVVAGCTADRAGWRLQQVATEAPRRFFAIDRWNYPTGVDPGAPPRTPGGAVLRDAVVADPGVAEFVRSNGVPDGIAIGPRGRTVELAYAERRRIVVLEHDARELVLPRDWVSSRLAREIPMTDEEVALLSPEPRMQKAVDDAGRAFAAGARFYAIFARLMRALPPPATSQPPGWGYGYTLTPATPIAARLFGVPDPGAQAEMVVWVDPDGPAAALLDPGDVVLERQPTRDGDPQTARVVDAAGERTISVAPERYPHAITPWYVTTRNLLAGATVGNVIVSSLLLDTLAVDDEVAWVVAHELAHVVLGHVDPQVTLGGIVQGLVRVGVVFPANLVVPGVGTIVDRAVGGIRNRFDRDDERAADAAGVAYARSAGYRADAAVPALERLTATFPTSKLAELLDSHPPGPERLEALRALVAEPS